MAVQTGKAQNGKQNSGPSRNNYWARGRLEANKVRRLMRHNGMTRADATALWRRIRITRCKGLAPMGAAR